MSIRVLTLAIYVRNTMNCLLDTGRTKSRTLLILAKVIILNKNIDNIKHIQQYKYVIINQILIYNVVIQPVIPNVTISSNNVRIRQHKYVIVNAGETFKLKCSASSWMPCEMQVQWRKLEGELPTNTR